MTRLGELRPTQLLYTFGVGATVDLMRMSALVLGLEEWEEHPGVARPVTEDRLLAAVRATLGRQVESLRLPPRTEGGEGSSEEEIGVPVATFPRWLRCTRCNLLSRIDHGLFKLDESPWRPERTGYVHEGCRGTTTPAQALPVRFLLACPRSHLDEFPWVEYAHRGRGCGAERLELREKGLSGGAADLMVECKACDAKGRSMADAYGEAAQEALPRCRGRNPHLGTFDDQRCPEPVRTITLGASNGWFPITRSVLSIPEAVDEVEEAIADLWETVSKAKDPEQLGLLIDTVGSLRRLARFDIDRVWGAVRARRTVLEGNGAGPSVGNLLVPEWEAFCNPAKAKRTRDFLLREVAVPVEADDWIAGVVLAERLREVVALLGFTRIDPPGEEWGEGTQAGSLSRSDPRWVPCAEVRGEGVFIRMSEDRLLEWEGEVGESGRLGDLLTAHSSWRELHGLDPDAGFPGARYILIHSFAHAFLRELGLECGYAATSLRERIYAHEGMAGVLIYTAAPDSEGTLGGLVSLGVPEELGPLIQRTLVRSSLCSSDPLCAEHNPVSDRTLHGAACHACLFASETSCERGNRYLDRALLVETLAPAGVAFIPPEDR